MHNAVLAAVVVVLTGVILLTRLRVGFAIVVLSAVLVPGTLAIHNPVTIHALFTRILVAALAVRLLFALRDHELPGWAFRWTPIHTAFVIFLATVFVAGVAFGNGTILAGVQTYAALLLVEPFVFFVVVLACVRAIDDLRWVLGVLAAALLLSAGIGIVEHFTRHAWGHFLYGRVLPNVPASEPLTTRATDVRVRAGAEYALQFGWVTAMLLPALLAWLAGMRVATRRWIPVAVFAVGVVLLAEYWSFSRTSLAAIGIVALLTAALARNRQLLTFAGSGLTIGVLLFVLIPRLQQGFVGLPSGPVDVRTARLPVILQIGLYHPLRGLGLGGLASSGLPNTDSSYLQLYGDAGIVGLVTAFVLLIVAGACCLRGLTSPDRTDRLAAAAGVTATLVMLVGGVAFDALRSLSSSRPFWLLIATGVVAAERVTGPLPALVRRPRWLLASGVIAAEVVGLAVFALAPVHHAVQYQFTTVPIHREVLPSDPDTVGKTYINTVCGLVTGVKSQHPDGRFDCRGLQQAAGVGQLRVQAPSADEVRTLVAAIEQSVQANTFIDFSLHAQTSIRSGRDTGLAWAPFWLPVATLLGLLLLPFGGRGPTPRDRGDPAVRAWRGPRRAGTLWGATRPAQP